MPLLPPRKGRGPFSYEEKVARTANLRRVELLVIRLLMARTETDAIGAGHGVWDAAPRPDGAASPLDSAPWTWLSSTAADAYQLAEHAAVAKIALFADGWLNAVGRNPFIEQQSSLRRPDPETAVMLFATGLGAVIGLDRRFPLFVVQQSTYEVDPLTRTFATRLVELRQYGVAVDPATSHLADTVLRSRENP